MERSGAGSGVCEEGDRCPHWERIGAEAGVLDLAAGPTPRRDSFDTGAADHAAVYAVARGGAVTRWPGEACEGRRCANWADMGEAFTSYRVDRGGLYVFGGDLGASLSVPVTTLTPDDFGYGSMAFARTEEGDIQMNVLLLLTSYADTAFEPGQDEASYRENLFGARERLESYFQRNAPDIDVEVELAGVVRHDFDRTLPCAHRWTAIDADDDPDLAFDRAACPDGVDGNGMEMATVEALEALPASVFEGFERFDRNGDGRFQDEELFVIHISAIPERQDGYPYGDNGGLMRRLPRCARLQGEGMRLCGAFLPIGDSTNFITIAHEAAHLFGALDLYGETNHSYQYTLMGSTIADREMFFHLDPWHKMTMGFATPRIVAIPDGPTGRQTVRLTTPWNSAAYEPILFYDPDRGTDEFFMLEYRANGASSYDRDVPSSGLVVWYVNTNSTTGDVLADLADVVFMGENCQSAGAAAAILGAPNLVPAQGEAWTRADDEVLLAWPSGGVSNLRFEVTSRNDGPFLEFDWWTSGPTVSVTAEPGSMTEEPGRSRPGNDFCAFDTDTSGSVEPCRTACQNNGYCAAYDFAIPDAGEPGRCFLKYQRGRSIFNDDIISGFKR